MSKRSLSLAILPVLALSACAVATPTNPTVVAMPGPGKTWDQFQQDQAACEAYARTQLPNAGQTAAASQQHSMATAAAGTVIGAGTGAAIGSLAGNVGAGAGIGALAGMLGGAAVAGNQTQATANSLQGRYDVAYAQCMVGHGESMQPPYGPVVYAAPGYPPPPPPPVYVVPGY